MVDMAAFILLRFTPASAGKPSASGPPAVTGPVYPRVCGANIPGKARALLTAPDSAPVMRAKRADVVANDYEVFNLQ